MSETLQVEQALFGRYDDPVAEGDSHLSGAAAVNTQLYENSPLSGSMIEAAYEGAEDRLFNDRKPNLAIQSEKPEHRVILFLKAQGLSNREIADRSGFSEPWVSQVLRQPWARMRLVRELQEAGQDAVQSTIKAAALDSVFRLIDERDNEKAKPSERISAANALLDRFLGKPMQKIESHSTISQGIAEVDKLKAELTSLEAEQARLTGTKN